MMINCHHTGMKTGYEELEIDTDTTDGDRISGHGQGT